MAVYTTPMGNRVRLNNVGNAVLEGGSDPNWTYAGQGGMAGSSAAVVFPYPLAANRDAIVALKISQAESILLGVSRNFNTNVYQDYCLEVYRFGNNYTNRGGATALNTVACAVDDIMAIRRIGEKIFGSVSKDNGVTWINVCSWDVSSTVDLVSHAFICYGSAVSGAYAKNTAPATAYDTFGDLVVGTEIKNMPWDTPTISWPNDPTQRLLADGNGFAVRDVSVEDSLVAAWYDMRPTDCGAAVFFKAESGSDLDIPRLEIFTTPGGMSLNQSIKVHIENGYLYATEYPEDGLSEGAVSSAPVELEADKIYCMEICRTDNDSNLQYVYRLMTAPGGVRVALVAQGVLEATNIPTLTAARILGSSTSNIMDPVHRVEALSVPFKFNSLGVAGFPSDDGTTITTLIGTGPDCHVPTLDVWWKGMGSSLVAQQRKHVGLMDKTSEFVVASTFRFSGKTTNSTYNILLKPRAGHAYYEHPDFMTNPLRYDATKGVSVTMATANQGGGTLQVAQDHMTVLGLQVQNSANGGGCAMHTDSGAASIHLCLVYAPSLTGNYSSIMSLGGSGAQHFGNILVAGNMINYGVEFRSSYMKAENFTIVAPVGSNAPAGYSIGIATRDYLEAKNFAVFGFRFASSGAGAAVLTNLISDSSEFSYPAGLTVTNPKLGRVFADQFLDVSKAGLNLHTKPGSDLYNAGVTPSAWNNASINGDRVKEGGIDVGAYEAPRFIPTKVALSGRASGTTGYPVTLRVSTNVGLIDAETQTISLADGQGGVFTPSVVTITGTEKFKDVSYLPTEPLGPRTVTATRDSGTYTLTAATHAYEVVAPIPAATLTMSTLAPLDLGQSGTFFLSTDNPLTGTQAVNYTLSADVACAFGPTTGTLSRTNLEDEITFTPGTAGPMVVTATPTGNPALPVLTKSVTVRPRPPSYGPGDNTYEVGTGKQFPTLPDIANFLASKDLVTDKARVKVWVFNDMPAVVNLRAAKANTEYFITVEPAPGCSYLEKATAGLYHYPNDGVELVLTGELTMYPLTVWRNFRVRVENGGRIHFWSGGGYSAGKQSFQNNRVLINRVATTDTFWMGEYFQTAHITDNVFVVTQPGCIGTFSGGQSNFTGNTIIATGAAIGNVYFRFGGYWSFNADYVCHNNAFVDCGPTPFSIDSGSHGNGWLPAYFSNNYTNNTLAADIYPSVNTGVLVNTSQEFVVNKATDLRPAAGSPLLGNASVKAVSTNDGAMQNRGFTPDVGAFQKVPAISLPVLKKASQDIQGQKLTLGMTYLNALNALTVTLPAHPTDPKGAVAQGPISVPFSNGQAQHVFSNIAPGKYGEPFFTGTNNGGVVTSNGSGFEAFAVDPILISAQLSDFIGVADTVLAMGKPKLPFRGAVTSDADVTPPRVSISANRVNFVVPDTLTITAAVSDNKAVTRVEFRKGATLVATQTVAPFVYSEPVAAGSTSTETYSATAFDAAGNSTVSNTLSVVRKVPAADAVKPTILSIIAKNPDYDFWGSDLERKDARRGAVFFEVTFSTPMDTSKAFDFPGIDACSLGLHDVVGSFWKMGSDTILYLTSSSHTPVLKGESLKFNYRKNIKRGWRDVNGVLLDSIKDMTVDLTGLNELNGYYAYMNFAGMAVGQSVIGRELTMAEKGGHSMGNVVVRNSPAIFQDGSNFISDGAGAVVPANNTQVVAGLLRSTYAWRDNYQDFGQSAAAIFFRLGALSDSPYALTFLAHDPDGKPLESLGKSQTFWVRSDGAIFFSHTPLYHEAVTLVPPTPSEPLVVGQEYCLETAHVGDAAGFRQSVRLWKSVNGVRTQLIGSASFNLTEGLNYNQFINWKISQVDRSAAPAKLTRIEAMYFPFMAAEVVPQLELTGKARLTKLSNVSETGTAGDYIYTGTNAASNQVSGGVFDKILFHKHGQDNGVQATIGATVNNIVLGAMFSRTPGQIGDLQPLTRTVFGIHAPALGAEYQFLINSRPRTPEHRLIVQQGDKIRMRSQGGSKFLVEVLQAGNGWKRIGKLRGIPGGVHNTNLSAEILLPGASQVSQLLYRSV